MEFLAQKSTPVTSSQISCSFPGLPLGASLVSTAVRVNSRNKLIGIIPKLSRSYSVKFDFKPSQFQPGWTNIIHLTSTGENCCNYGDRIPAVWVRSRSSGATTNKLEVSSAINNNGNFFFSPRPATVPLGQWTTVEITQLKEGNSYRYSVKVGGRRITTAINRKAREFTNVIVFGADDWSRAAKGSMRNLVINPNVIGRV